MLGWRVYKLVERVIKKTIDVDYVAGVCADVGVTCC